MTATAASRKRRHRVYRDAVKNRQNDARNKIPKRKATGSQPDMRCLRANS